MYSCGSKNRAGRSHPRRRPATSRYSFPATLAPTLNIHSRLKWAGGPGGTATLDAQAACCGPPGGRRPARATLKGRKSSGNNSLPLTIHDCRVRPVAHPPSGFAPGRRGRQFDEPRYSPSVQAAEACGAHSNVSCGPPRSEASARATLRVARATHLLSGSSSARPPRAAKASPLPRTAIPEESRYSLSD